MNRPIPTAGSSMPQAAKTIIKGFASFVSMSVMSYK